MSKHYLFTKNPVSWLMINAQEILESTNSCNLLIFLHLKLRAWTLGRTERSNLHPFVPFFEPYTCWWSDTHFKIILILFRNISSGHRSLFSFMYHYHSRLDGGGYDDDDIPIIIIMMMITFRVHHTYIAHCTCIT